MFLHFGAVGSIFIIIMRDMHAFYNHPSFTSTHSSNNKKKLFIKKSWEGDRVPWGGKELKEGGGELM